MFDIGWPEITVILIIALLVIGPRDLPRAMHAVGRWVRKARAVTSEFQRHVDDMVREADMEDVRELKKLGKFNKHNIAREIGKVIDPTGEIQEKTDIRGTQAASKPAMGANGAANGPRHGKQGAGPSPQAPGSEPANGPERQPDGVSGSSASGPGRTQAAGTNESAALDR